MRRGGRALAGLTLLLGCAGGPPPETGGAATAAPTVTGEALAGAEVAVLPLGALALGAGAAPSGGSRDSLVAALGGFAHGALATALDDGGAVGAALGPGAVAGPLAAQGSERIRTALEAVGAVAPGDVPAALTGPGQSALAALGEALGTRYLLLPLALRLAADGVLAYRGELDAALVDAPAGVVLWRETIRARDPLPPSGAVDDVLAEALERTIAATARALAERLTRLGREEAEAFDETTPP